MNIKRCSKIIYKSNEYKACKYFNTLYESENELFRIQSSLDGNVIDTSTGTWLGANASKVLYSTNNDGTWRTLSGVTSITLNKNDKLYLKSSTGIGKNSLSDLPLIKSSKTFSVLGNLDYIIPTVKSFSLNNFFIGTKVEKVYLKMNVELDVNEYGFYRMFKNCTSLSSCYFDAETMDFGIGNGNISVSTFIPGDYCFCEMFYGCTSLNSDPSNQEGFLFVGDLSIGAHQCDSMYYGCTNMLSPSLFLLSIIDLDHRNVADYAYYRTFYNCNKLVSLGAAFLNNSAVTPEGGDTVGNYSYSEMFYNCSSLTTYGLMGEEVEKFYLYSGGSYGYYRMFYGCTSLDSADFIDTSSAIGNYACDSMFMNCTSLKNTICLSATSIGSYSYRSMFEGCTSLNNVTIHFKPASVAIGGCYRMFANCTSLVNSNSTLIAPDYTYCYYQMFYNCKSLTGANSFYSENSNIWVDFWWSPYSCYGMFEGCVSLKSAPNLNGYLIQDHAFERMFYGCSSLNYLYCRALPGKIEYTTILGQTIPRPSATNGTSNWVVGVPSSGNFYYRNYTGILWQVFGSGSGIPSGWATHPV